MKYLQGSFTVGGASKQYSDNYDRIFGKKEDKAEEKTVEELSGTALMVQRMTDHLFDQLTPTERALVEKRQVELQAEKCVVCNGSRRVPCGTPGCALEKCVPCVACKPCESR